MLTPLTSLRRPSLKTRRRYTNYVQLVVLFYFVIFIWHHNIKWQSLALHHDTHTSNRTIPALSQTQALFWRRLNEQITRNGPELANPPEHVIPYGLEIQFDPVKDSIRPDLLWLDSIDIKKLKVKHAQFVHDLESGGQELIYRPHTRGIVMTASGESLPVLVISVRMIRRTGSHLPIEVFLNSADDYDIGVCEHILPSLNATCIVVQDVLHHTDPRQNSENHQLKSFATLFSSFEDILVLEADAFPIRRPDQLFETAPFNDSGMVTWPDFWFPSESPYYFEIANIETPPELTNRPSSAGGQLMFSKSKHGLALMLAAYYNYYGPEYYYPLLSQGGPGYGDKETFTWAATIMSEKWYVVDQPVLAAGHVDSNGEWIGSAMIQFDPTEDFRQQTQKLASTTITNSSSTLNTPLVKKKPTSPPTPFFIHANHPPFDPSLIFQPEINGAKTPTRDSNGTIVRSWNWTTTTTSKSKHESHPFKLYGSDDIEKQFWQEIKHVACDYKGMFEIWRQRDTAGMCRNVKKYMQKVFK